MTNSTRYHSPGVVRRHLVTLIAAAFPVIVLGGCETMSHAEQGEVIGGALGGVLGSQVGHGDGRTAAIIIGTLAGAMIGRHIGETMDDNDRRNTAEALETSRTGDSTTWINPDTGYAYEVTPTRTFDFGEGPCREFRLDASVGNSPDEEVYGSACRQADGSWLIQ